MDIVGPNGHSPTGGSQKQPDIDVHAQPDIKCDNCEGIFFQPAFKFKKISKLLTGSPIDQVQPVEVYRCMDCGMPSDII